MRWHLYFILIGLIPFFTAAPTYAADKNLPRFASLSSSKVHLRAGPGKQYPVKWVYQRKGYPVEIVREYDVWRKIRDQEGYSGWVYQGLLSGKRTALVISHPTQDTPFHIHRNSSEKSDKIAFIESNALISIESCKDAWCKVSAQGITGWIQRKVLWGIYEHEVID